MTRDFISKLCKIMKCGYRTARSSRSGRGSPEADTSSSGSLALDGGPTSSGGLEFDTRSASSLAFHLHRTSVYYLRLCFAVASVVAISAACVTPAQSELMPDGRSKSSYDHAISNGSHWIGSIQNPVCPSTDFPIWIKILLAAAIAPWIGFLLVVFYDMNKWAIMEIKERGKEVKKLVSQKKSQKSR